MSGNGKSWSRNQHQQNNNKPVKKNRPVFEMGEEATMYLSSQVVEQIRYLHAQTGNIEWSGFLAVQLKGSLSDISKLRAEVLGIYPCNIGTSGFTEYMPMDDLMEFYECFPEMDGGKNPIWDGGKHKDGAKIGVVHTHHNMGIKSDFSIVDMTELDDNVTNHGLYISLIVHMDGNYSAKGAFVVEREINNLMTPHDYPATKFKIAKTEEWLVTFDFEMEFDTDDYIIDQYAHIQERALIERRKATAIKTINNYKPAANAKGPTSNLPSSIPGIGDVYFDDDGNCYDADGQELIVSAEEYVFADY